MKPLDEKTFHALVEEGKQLREKYMRDSAGMCGPNRTELGSCFPDERKKVTKRKDKGEDVIARAATLAEEIHAGQKYGEKPYTEHLQDTFTVLAHACGHGRVTEPDTESWRFACAAAWLHDALEDTNTSWDVIAERVSPRVAVLVEAVTGRGTSRRNRLNDIAEKIERLPDLEREQATAIKLADRIANVEACWATRDKRLFMYEREYTSFQRLLRKETHGAVVQVLWDILERHLKKRD
jgi:(p)ppGpp synthase/HD superfamily hydrolase